jgi:hypothetical protein
MGLLTEEKNLYDSELFYITPDKIRYLRRIYV